MLIARRLATGAVLIVLAAFVSFLLVSATGDPLAALKAQNPPPAPSVMAADRHRLHLDQPLLSRFFTWLSGIPRGNFGPSVNPNERIGPELLSRLGVTSQLVVAGLLTAFLLAVLTGVLGAVRQASKVDYALTLASFLFISMPSFWFAVLLKQGGIWVNERLGTTVFFTIGSSSPVVAPGFLSHLDDSFAHMVLPTISLALIAYGSWSRYQRSAMIEELSADYVRYARARGLRWRRVVFKHALRNALAPMITVSAIDVATILGGAVVIEEVFQWQGMGDFLVQSVQSNDIYAVASWMLVAGTVVVVANLVADLLGFVLDPNTRHE